jgi:hypothetical protein
MTYGTTTPAGETRALLPSYSPSVSRATRNSLGRSFGDAAAAPGWPATFEDGADMMLKSPAAAMVDPSTFSERAHILAEEMSELGKGGQGQHHYHHAGTSTFKEAVFNAINVLLGVGVLASPFALRSSGWLIGVPLFFFFAFTTNHTGKLLGKCLEYQEGMTVRISQQHEEDFFATGICTHLWSYVCVYRRTRTLARPRSAQKAAS